MPRLTYSITPPPCSDLSDLVGSLYSLIKNWEVGKVSSIFVSAKTSISGSDLDMISLIS
jgi:hypothetical protein